MGRVTAAEYHVKRRQILMLMGGRCVKCGCPDLDQLEFGHVKPRTWIPNRMNRMQRLRRYWRDWKMGLVEVQCRGCNNRMNGLVPRWKQLNELVQKSLDLGTQRD